MPNRRDEHMQKTMPEKRAYMNEVIKGVEPTVASPSELIEPTDQTVEQPFPPVFEPTKPTLSAKLLAILKQEWAIAVTVPLMLIVLGLIGWLFHEVYGLNREVGELKGHIQAVEVKDEEIKNSIAQLEQSTRRDVDLANQRILQLEARPSH